MWERENRAEPGRGAWVREGRRGGLCPAGRRWLITAVLAVGILIVSLVPKMPDLDVGVSFADKIGHFGAYLVLGFMLFVSIPWKGLDGGWGRLRAVALTVAIAGVYGALIEVLQGFTGRQPELWDLAADLAGALAGALAAGFVARRRAGGRR